jgi:hypothetical protein
MGAPIGNRNAAGPHSGYRTSGAKKYLRRQMSPYTRKQMNWYQGSTPASIRKQKYIKVRKIHMKFT